ncbi:MAG: hypothetical protein IIY71_00210 [Oscillospiraceae bacterium]|nr:hypothetical protein [Oscillospiraceae bacterium]
MRGKSMTILFAVLLFGFAIWNLLTPDQEFSENENRYLAQRPGFSANALFDGSYMKELGEYITDQFPLRNEWVGLKTLSERSTGKRDSGGVYFAKDGFLIEQFCQADQVRLEKNIESVVSFSNYTQQKLGVSVQVLLAPVASGVLEEKLPAHAPEVDQAMLLQQADEAGVHLVNVMEPLQAHDTEYIYYKTDHHWTSLGAYYAYQAWQATLGRETKPLSAYTEEVLSDQFFGTTYSKANLYTIQPDTITAYYTTPQTEVWYNDDPTPEHSFYTRSYLKVKDKYSVFLNGNQPITKVIGHNPQGGKLLLIKDSYANTFAQFAIEDYAEVHLVDLRYWKESVTEYIQEQGITNVLILYNLKNFTIDQDIYALGADVQGKA